MSMHVTLLLGLAGAIINTMLFLAADDWLLRGLTVVGAACGIFATACSVISLVGAS